MKLKDILKLIKRQPRFGKGALPDPYDYRDYKYEDVLGAEETVDWNKGYDIEKEIGAKIPFKNQGLSGSCVGQAISYYSGVLNTVETKKYDEVSAKSIYSLIELGLPQGGAYIRDGMKLVVDLGALFEKILSSYKNGLAPDEPYMKDKSWKTESILKLAKILQAKEYRTITNSLNMNTFAIAVKNNYGIVGGVNGSNNNTWNSFEPRTGPSSWGHALYFGKFGTDKLGKYIATPNSWGTRGNPDELHSDGWQKLREEWFTSEYMFSPWTLIDKPNFAGLSPEASAVLAKAEMKLIVEGTGSGRVGIVINGKLLEISNDRKAAAALYLLANNGFGFTVNTTVFEELPKNHNF